MALSPELDRQLRVEAEATGQSRNAIIQLALRDYLRQRRLDDIELKMQARARILGIESDADVVELVRQTRSGKPSPKRSLPKKHRRRS